MRLTCLQLQVCCVCNLVTIHGRTCKLQHILTAEAALAKVVSLNRDSFTHYRACYKTLRCTITVIFNFVYDAQLPAEPSPYVPE